MSSRCTIALSLAVLAIAGNARAGQPPAPTASAAINQAATVTRAIAQLASVTIVAPAGTGPARLATRQADLSRGKSKPTRNHAKAKLAEKSSRRRDQAAEAATPCVRPIGKAETGTAAWYGGRYVGRRTTSGSRLDTIHPTAAHRTLPLNSLARVTNLDNGRSVVVRVTDRGPISASLLIDMSPRAADDLQMKHAGVVPVRVEQVVEVPTDTK
jgi:rare lipoprotein A